MAANPLPFVDLQAQQRRIAPLLAERIQAVLDHGQYIMGPEVELLEQRLAEYVGVDHCIGVSSGTDALVIALMALGIGPGDEVITTPFSFIATAEAILWVGARPVFVDIDAATYNLDPGLIAPAVTARTKAILAVSLYGQCADFGPINRIAERHGLAVVEDAAQSLGATYAGGRSCGLTTIGCTSFFPTKPLGGYGDGGACFTRDARLAEAMRQIRVHGQERRYHHVRLGLNGRLDTLQAAILLAKLEVFEDEVARRGEIGNAYTRLFAERGLAESGRVVPPRIGQDRTSVYGQYTVRVAERDRVAAMLKERGIPTAVHYPSLMSRQDAVPAQGGVIAETPVAARAADEVLSLPMHPYLRQEEQGRVVDALVEIVGETTLA